MAEDETYVNVLNKFNDVLYCTSKLNFLSYKLEWRIESFHFICQNVKFIESQRFPAKNLENTQWYLRLEPTALNDTNTEDFCILLKNTELISRSMNVKIGFSSGYACQTFSASNFINKRHEFEWTISGSKFYSVFKKTVPITLTVYCIISIYDSGTMGIKTPLINSPKCNDLIENMKIFLGNEDFKDVRFKVENEEFSAHKVILAMRSPIFAAMFKSKMSEGLSSVVEIKDTKPTIFQQMLSFIYSDNVENLEESALELCYLAEKYQLEKLKTMCINSLCTNLSSKTVIDTIILADLFSISMLKDKCLKHLIMKFESYYETEEFQQLIQNRPHLMPEIMKMQKNVTSNESDYFEPLNFEFRKVEK